MLKSVTRHREFTGPTPHSVSILARPTHKKPPDHLTQERRHCEDLRENSLANARLQKLNTLRSQWEMSTDKQIQKNTIKREVDKYMTYGNIMLEKRREKLREMLSREEEELIHEMESTEETTEDRQQRMKERAKMLREKREKERSAFVAERMKKKFWNECEELRSEISKQKCDQIFRDRHEQVRMKCHAKEHEREFENFYADLWEKDRLAKAQREELETKEQYERNRSTLEILNLQTKANQNQREEERQVKQMEAEWLKKEAELRSYEEEMLKQEKREKQKATRRARDISIKLKHKKDAKERDEEIAIETRMMDQVLQEAENQAAKVVNKKENMRDEVHRFMNYIEKTRETEQQREKEVEQLVNDDIEEQWKKKDARKRLEREARKALLQNVMEKREAQRKEKEEAIRQEHILAMSERKKMFDEMEEHRRMEEERIARIRLENLQHQNDLEEQIKYQRSLKEKEIEKARRELLSMQKTEQTYQHRKRSALAELERNKLQPLRITGHSTLANRAQSC